jgi:hypothetical protein
VWNVFQDLRHFDSNFAGTGLAVQIQLAKEAKVKCERVHPYEGILECGDPLGWNGCKPICMLMWERGFHEAVVEQPAYN